MTINARSEMDLDEDTVLEKVSKASGVYPIAVRCIPLSVCTVLQILFAACARSEKKNPLTLCLYIMYMCVCVFGLQVLTSVFIRRRLAPCLRLVLW